MKKRLLSLCVAMLMCLGSFGAFAETAPITPSFKAVEVNYNRAAGTVTISGEAPFAINMSEPVRLMVLKPDSDNESTNLEKLINGTVTFAEVGVHVDEVMLSADKSFTFAEFTLSSTLTAGDYTLRLVSENVTYADVICVASTSETVSSMNSMTDTSMVWSNIEKYNDVYQLEIDENSAYYKLSDDGKEQVLSGLCNKTYTDADAIKNDFNVLVQLARIKTGPWGVLDEIINNNYSILGLMPYMSAFNALNTEQKDLVYKALVGNAYQTASDFALAFNNAIAEAGNSYISSGNDFGSKRGDKISSAINVPMNLETEKTEGQKTFKDLKQYAWAEESILKLYNKGIVNGKANNIFAPADFVTRSEAIKMIVLAFGEVDMSAECNFEDVPKDSWMYPYIATAMSQKIIYGYDDTFAGTNDTITREDFATMILRALKAINKTLGVTQTEKSFSDNNKISDYAKEAVHTLQQAGVINGADNNYYLPKNSTTRAEAAKIIAALLD